MQLISHRLIWNPNIPARTCFFICEVYKDVIQSRSKLSPLCLRRTILVPSGEVESVNHLLCRYDYSRNIWKKFCDVFGYARPLPLDVVSGLDSWWRHSWSLEPANSAWKLFPFDASWLTLKERNNRIFRESPKPWECIFDDCLILLWSWASSWKIWSLFLCLLGSRTGMEGLTWTVKLFLIYVFLSLYSFFTASNTMFHLIRKKIIGDMPTSPEAKFGILSNLPAQVLLKFLTKLEACVFLSQPQFLCACFRRQFLFSNQRIESAAPITFF